MILEKIPLKNDEKNSYQVSCFMQMEEFDTDIKKGYYKFEDGDIKYITE